MKIFVIILNFNGKEFILSCLDSVKNLKTDDSLLKIVVVDNASADGSAELVEKRYKDLPAGKAGIKILRNKDNLGFAEGNNVGIRYALENGADYILVLNPDTIVDKNLIVQLIKVAEPDPGIGILGLKIYFASGFEFHKERYKPQERGKVIWYAGGIIDWENVLASHRGVDEVDKGHYEKQTETDFVSGCAMFVKRKVFDKIGLFDPKYFLYYEDNDFCQRAQKAGFKVVYVPQVKLWHLNAGSSASGGPLQEYYITRNRLLFGLRYAPWRSKLALFKESLRLLISGRKWQKIGARDFYLRRFGKGSWR